MELISTDLPSRVRELHARLRKRRVPHGGALEEEPPLRSEIFSAEQMEQHGRHLARLHVLATTSSRDRLLPRLAANEEILRRVFHHLTNAVHAGRPVTPASEWLLDNFHLIDEQIRTAWRHLPRNYSLELPRLARGPLAGFPRVYDLALETIAHVDGRVDFDGLGRFLAAYESVATLNTGELWAVPIMLRLALIENLRRVAMRIEAGRHDRDLADAWARRMLATVDADPKSLIVDVADLARSKPPMSTPFVCEFVRALQGRSPSLVLALNWIEQRLAEDGLTIEQLVQAGGQVQAADQVTVGNSIGSLRLLSSVDWRDFVEARSAVDRVLREDPVDAYARMDFQTRNRYREVIERIARRSGQTEPEVAAIALGFARRAASAGDTGSGESARRAHVGYYLVDRGLSELERAARYPRTPVELARSAVARAPLLAYVAAVAAVTTLAAGYFWTVAQAGGIAGWPLLFVAALAALAGSQVAIALVNWLATLLVAPRTLPRMDFSDGIPTSSSTLVVVPTVLASVDGVDDLADALEVRFLANRDANLRFALLTDLRDAAREVMPDDGALLAHAQARIEGLNARHGSDAFYLLHRPRRWNPGERVWMGYERKRGKLSDLNALLRDPGEGGSSGRFSLIVGNAKLLSSIRYVITLDTDTQLPRDAARQLVATMAHPLNRPVWNARIGRVTVGYGILQPRVSPSLPGANRTRYARLHSGEPGIDPYTRTVSDVYQDLFDEGSFIGKGIYDVEAFERSLQGRLPENLILSHDLLEGGYARSGLQSDVELLEDYPATYTADVARRHRWIRGDWQIAGWLLPSVRGAAGRRYANPLSALSRWKIADNLRRSLVPIAILSLLLVGWCVLPSATPWTVVVAGIVLVPALLGPMLRLARIPREAALRPHLAATLRAAGSQCAQALAELAWLPHEAWVNADAVLRSTWRMLVSRRNLLEWCPSGDHIARAPDRLSSFLWSMWMSPVLSLAVGAWLAIARPATLIPAAPILLLWMAGPAIAWWVSRPLARQQPSLTPEQQVFLRRLSRRTWAFFETVVGPEDHWLPPDNLQEQPGPTVAHRTSPTNMGLALLANLVACDFGYLPAARMLERTAKAVGSMASLERYRGHFYNWYDTRSLQPLLPKYVSTVDSGNLAVHLLTLRIGLLALPDQPVFSRRVYQGLADTIGIVREMRARATVEPLEQLGREVDAALAAGVTTLGDTRRRLDRMVLLAETAAGDEGAADVATAPGPGDWMHALLDQCRAARDEFARLAPWTSLASAPVDLAGALPDVQTVTLRDIARLPEVLQPIIEHELAAPREESVRAWLHACRAAVAVAGQLAARQIATIDELARQLDEFAAVDFDFLYDGSRRLLAIGYNVTEGRRDGSHYDLLASEARITSFLAVAQGKLPQEAWFALGRSLTRAAGEQVLLSWSGSMFEYLMPQLVMPAYPDTLIEQSNRAAVRRQIEYGRQRGVPWGTSESGYNLVDANRNYQYRAFGVPGLRLRRGLADDLVIAPYASALAVMVEPEAACENLQRLAAEGLHGHLGFYEAADFTPSRRPRGQRKAIVRSYMAHHQAMSLLALADLLLDHPLQKRFEAHAPFQATLTLLHERVPTTAILHPRTATPPPVAAGSEPAVLPVRVITRADAAAPAVQLLSNGSYHVLVTGSGGGYSRWKDLAITRWEEDSTRDHRGSYCYIRELASGAVWSNTLQPTLREPEHYEAIFTEGRAEFHRRDRIGETVIEARTEIVVSPEDDIELRRIRLVNRSSGSRTLEVTTYAEAVLAAPIADALHPAFGKLFAQTEVLKHKRAVLCTRRPRARGEQPGWLFHLMAVSGRTTGEASFETDRAQFIGRGRTLASPRALDAGGPLSGRQGAVLDPIVAIRQAIVLGPDQVATIDLVTGAAPDRHAAEHLIDRYQDSHSGDRVLDLAWTHNQVVLRQFGISETDAQDYQHLAGSVIFANPAMRADAGVIARNRRGQSALWGYSISGDLPIVLLQIADPANIGLVRQLLEAHAYWRLKGLAVDLVIWTDDRSGYRQQLHDAIMGLIATSGEPNVLDRPGGIVVRPTDHISPEDRELLQAVARIVIVDGRGRLSEQVKRRGPPGARTPLLQVRAAAAAVPATAHRPHADLVLANGLGGFSRDGREYVITLAPGHTTPAPWVNVIANPQFGTVVSESGSAYTWCENAHEFRLTPWHNDPVTDASGEALYLRDEESGRFWSPTPLPAPGEGAYVARHGFGYSVFEHDTAGIHSELTVHVARDAPVKFAVLRLRSDSPRTRRLSVTGYAEWVLGDLRAKSAMHVTTEIDAATGAVLARNPYNTEFPDRVAFFDTDDANRTVTADRLEFLGRHGSIGHPAAMKRTRLSGSVGAALDPCTAMQVGVELLPGQERTVVFRIGVGRGHDDARSLIRRFRGNAAARDELGAVRDLWARTLGAVQVQTPDPALDVMTNGWLLYQTLGCRLWARSGYYQSGGAFGFRDQLQDVMALVHAEPTLVRAHLLLCASRQFVEGDVQHWWHPPSGRGVRTRCSDDYLWLPLATCRYVFATGDWSVLDDVAPFLDGRAVNPGDESYYDLPGRSGESATLYQHCVRAIRRGFAFGVHGLPLMGSGDWNDGMNRVGIEGRGESVWLAFFLYEVLRQFCRLARQRGDADLAGECDAVADRLRANVERHGWDGAWYRRAYFDDGTPLGSATNAECQIDSIAQSWSVLSGAGDAARSREAMDALDQRLVRRRDALVQLLDPPFDRSTLDPGYIRGYVPGIRENGGQYTHAAIWAAMAFAALGDSRRAWDLFRIINPVDHSLSNQASARYKVEPYVVAADVYASPSHLGRGGWTWYTGSAGWCYRLIVESLLGVRREGDALRFEPCLPEHWTSFSLRYRFRDTPYHVVVQRKPAHGAQRPGSITVQADGLPRPEGGVPLVDDGKEHFVEVSLFTVA